MEVAFFNNAVFLYKTLHLGVTFPSVCTDFSDLFIIDIS